jgi:hypothetical protein
VESTCRFCAAGLHAFASQALLILTASVACCGLLGEAIAPELMTQACRVSGVSLVFALCGSARDTGRHLRCDGKLEVVLLPMAVFKRGCGAALPASEAAGMQLVCFASAACGFGAELPASAAAGMQLVGFASAACGFGSEPAACKAAAPRLPQAWACCRCCVSAMGDWMAAGENRLDVW